jgi:hypothetical protein
MCSLLNRFGYPRHPSATAWEYAHQIRNKFGGELDHLSAAVDAITTDFVEFRYSEHELTPERRKAIADTLASLDRDLRVARRQKLLSQ